MALVTVQRSPSPSTDHEADSLSEDTTDGKTHLKKRLKTSKQKLRKVFSSVRFLSKLRPGLSESYFAYKGAALILPHTECTRKSSKKSHGGEIQGHLQAMLLLLRPQDQIKIAVRLEDVPKSVYKRYICVVSTRGRQDTEEAVIIGMDCRHGEAVIGLVLPIWLGVKIQLEGDGSFRLCTDEQAYLFNPVSVQAMWSAIQSLVKVVHNAEEMKYIHDGLTHTWVGYYRSRIDHEHVTRSHHWNIEGVDVFAPNILNLGDVSDEEIKRNISSTMKVVMMSVDLEEVTCRALRQAVEERLGFSIQKYKAYFDEEMIRIFGQMKGPSKILDYLYLGSEWNASNLDELKAIGIGYILNVTKEIDNFFAGTFQYYSVRVVDVPESDLLRHWDKTYKFISKARSHGSKVFVHCKMGISRSASTTMAYLMKENRWGVDEAFAFVKERRNVANPNEGFMEQLRMYEAILSASNKRYYFHNKDLDQQTGSSLEEGIHRDQDYDCMLGDSMMNAMASDWMNSVPFAVALEEDSDHLQYGSRLLPLGPDLEGTESRSGDSYEESLPDLPSSSLSTEKQEVSPDGMSDQICSANPSTNQGLFKVKPDSFWIKEDTIISEGGCVEMLEESRAEIFTDNQYAIPMTEDQQNLKSTNAVCHGDKKLNPSSLSKMDYEAESSSSSCPLSNPQYDSTSFHSICDATASPSSSSFIPISLSQISAHDAHSSSNVSLPALSMTEHMETFGRDSSPVITKPNPIHMNPSPNNAALVKVCEGHGLSKDNQETPNSSHRHLHTNSSTASDTLTSMQLKDGSDTGETEATTGTACPPTTYPGKLESGVRDYFFREKIPWNPGKVQKIREGIDRVGFTGDITIEDNGSDNSEGMDVIASDGDRGGGDNSELTVDCNESALEDDGRFKMDINKEKIILDECMEVPSSKKITDTTFKIEDTEGLSTPKVSGALSLYEKEEIPMEPGTVLRTRMEIEERQKFSRSSTGDIDVQAPSSPTKPVIRTSSLKGTSKDTSHATCSLPPRRVSCGPVMERIKNLRKLDYDDADDDDLMMEEDVNETEIVIAMNEDENCPVQGEKVKIESKLDPHNVDLGPNLKTESSTDPDDNSGVVKSFVRKIEKHPTTDKKMPNSGSMTCPDGITPDTCDDIQFGPPLHTLTENSVEGRNVKIDLGFISGESNTDSQLLLHENNPDQHHDATKDDVPTTVRHLVGQFETKMPQDNVDKAGMETEHPASDDHRPADYESRSLQIGDHEHAIAPVERTDHEKLPLNNAQGCVNPRPSSPPSEQQTESPISSTAALSETKVSHTADVRSTTDGAYSCKEDRQKEIWNPYQQISPELTVEDISSLRQKFEGVGGKQQTQLHDVVEKNRKLPRPKSVERMCGVFEGKCKSDTSLTDDSKDCPEASFRQVSEEGRKVRRLHGKSHPLTKLSQGRGVFHSSM